MDEYPSKRVVGAVGFNRKGSSVAVRGNQESRSIQHCNRLGCSTSHSSLRATQNGNPEKPKLSRPAFLSTSSRATVGSSSRTSSNLNDQRKSSCARRNKSSLQGRVAVENSSRQEQKEFLKSSIKQEDTIKLGIGPSSLDVQTIHPEAEAVESSDVQGFITNGEEASSSSSRNQKTTRKTESSNHSSSSSVRHSVVPRNASHGAKPSKKQVANERKYGLRNLSCTSVSNVLPSGSSSSGHYKKRMDTLRKRYNDVENSAARGEKSTVSSNRGHPGSSSNGPGVSLLERPLSQPASRRTRNQLTSRDGVLSGRTQRFSNGDNRTRISDHADANNYFLPEPLMIPSLTQAHISLGEAATASLSLSLPDYVAPICRGSFGQSGSRSGTTTRRRQIANSEDTNSSISHDTWIDRESFRSLNMEGLEEVLLTLERIEQDEELTYEQLMVLQSNLFVGGIGFHDQHRDWRLDIDNMSYEELLALEEKMGTVSTALSEEELLKCLKKGVYTPTSALGATCRDDVDDVKCSICQEEYIAGDELGGLHCDHRYHMSCIHQWLRQKNWCPICKSSACPC